MISLDTNVVLRYLTRDDEAKANDPLPLEGEG